MAQYSVNNYSVDNIISWINSGEIAIPEMQRPFVWDSTKVRDLIDSLYKGYPIGYIIIWKNPDVKLKDGTLSIGKKIVIDGQQRITALTAAITGREVINQEYKKIPIKISFNPIEEVFEVYNPAIGKNSKMIDDIAPIFKPGFDSFTFSIDYAEKNNVKAADVNRTITKLQDFKNNNIGIIELDASLDIETVTDIFIRINSKGTVLSQADFAMSKISSNERYGGDIIRKTIDYFCHLLKRPMDIEMIKENDKDFSNLDEFNKLKWISTSNEEIYTPLYTDVLRVAFTSQFLRGRLAELVSLLSGRNFENRGFEDSIAEEAYGKLKNGVLEVINKTNFERFIMIIKSTGIIDKSLIRSDNALNFAYALYIILRRKKYHPDYIETVVRKWLVLSLLTGRYSGSPESMFDYDIKRFDRLEPMEYLKSVEIGELSDAYWEHILPARLNTSVASSPFFKIFLMSQVKEGNKGFLSKHITVQALIEDRGDIHHLFPKKYLQKNGLNIRGEYNQIANYVYTQSEINIKIRDAAPNEYMQDVLEQIDNNKANIGGIVTMEDLKETFKENCIPNEFINFTIDNYKDFLQKRRILISQKIKECYFNL
ncbi:GmrSD restriction endonuclease domain-containing protein [Faecalibacillus intestinalis]|uniref:GmrSD restriction endonuclease domain-containing protein n=1 Tax=Faecalibacillus intestinalis TaxID=1982626 RepID=UPI003522E646